MTGCRGAPPRVPRAFPPALARGRGVFIFGEEVDLEGRTFRSFAKIYEMVTAGREVISLADSMPMRRRAG